MFIHGHELDTNSTVILNEGLEHIALIPCLSRGMHKKTIPLYYKKARRPFLLV